MPAPWRLLAAIGAGVAHFALTLQLGPGIHCAEARGCADTQWVRAPDGDVFFFPLSLVREALPAFSDGWSFSSYAACNSAAFGLVVLVALWIYATVRARLPSVGAPR
jgi:hypothetical protein